MFIPGWALFVGGFLFFLYINDKGRSCKCEKEEDEDPRLTRD